MKELLGCLVQRAWPRTPGHRSARIATALVLLGSACFSAGYVPQAGAAATPPSLAKSYTGTAHNLTASESGVITLTDVTQNGGAIAGTFTFQAPLVGTGPFKGTITPTAVTFTVVPTAASCPACTSVVFSGKFWPIGSMSGTWVAQLKSGGSQNGTWGVGSTWNGTLHSVTADTTTGMGIGALTEGASGALVGTLVIYGSRYGGVATLTGSVQGPVVKFTSRIRGSGCYGLPFNFVGTLTTFGGMSGTWFFPGNCRGTEKGLWQVQRSGTQAAV